MSLSTPVHYRGLQITANCVHMIGVSILSYCLAQRIPPLYNWRQWKYLTWGRICVILVLFDSWLFVFTSGLLVNGIGLTWSQHNCKSAVVLCISFYGLSKILIYAFLSEKVYIVWSGGNQISRLSSKSYQICGVVLFGYVAILVLMVLGREGRIREDGVCLIGLRAYAGISVISYDLFLNVFLTAMFLWPLWKSKPTSPRLRVVAVRTLYGACISLITSATNITIVTALGGNELGWICLSSCVSDVCLNAMALFWVSSSPCASSDIIRDRYSLPNLDMSALTIAQDEPRRQTPSHADGITFTSTQPTLALHGATLPITIPEDYFDYIPKEHRMYRDVEKQEDPIPLSPTRTRVSSAQSCGRENLQGGPSRQSSPETLLTRFLRCSHSESEPDSEQERSHSLEEKKRSFLLKQDSVRSMTEVVEVQEKDICDS